MVKNLPGCNILRCKIYRLLFLLFLAVFAISPIVDAYTDSLCSSPVLFDDLYDPDSPISINDLKLNDALDSLYALKNPSKRNNNDHTPLLHDLATADRITKPQLPTNDSGSSQHYSLSSSDPSPPVI